VQVHRKAGAPHILGKRVEAIQARLRTELGYEPRFDAVAAIRDFAAADRGLRLVPAIGVGSVLDRIAGAR